MAWIDSRELFTVKEVAKTTKKSESWWWKAIKRGDVEVVRLGKSVRITRDELDRVINEAKTKKGTRWHEQPQIP